MANEELPIIQKTYDLILWYVPRLNKFPRDSKFVLGDRIQATLYDFLEGLILARYRRKISGLKLLQSVFGWMQHWGRMATDSRKDSGQPMDR